METTYIVVLGGAAALISCLVAFCVGVSVGRAEGYDQGVREQRQRAFDLLTRSID